MNFSNLIKNNQFYFLVFILLIFFNLSACGIYKKTDSRDIPINAMERAKKNVEEGRGSGIGNLINRGNTSYEFSTSNPLWRASLETLDFLPLTNVDYSGGLISTDWYNSTGNLDYLKITIRFLSNDISATSLKIIVHEKKCKNSNNCVTSIINSKIEEELRRTILSKAAILEKNSKKK